MKSGDIMKKIVFLNSGILDYDELLDYSQLEKLGILTNHANSSYDDILDRVQGQDIVIVKELPLPKELIEEFPASVKLICESGTGYNNIDVEAATEKGITVCNVPGYSTEAVAQLAIQLILNLSSSMVEQQKMISRKDFSNFTDCLKVPHVEVKDKTLGLIGTGSIGGQVMKVALALGMNILTYSRTPKKYDNPNIKSASLEELLKNSDFISIHCPLTEDTKYLINKETLKMMKPTAYIINTARGPIVKEADIIDALKNKVIAGAALDVQEIEPLASDNPLFTMDNVIITPHIGWKCFESRQRLVNLTADSIDSFIKDTPINVVN